MMKICILGNAQSKHIIRWASFFKNRGHDISIVSARFEKIDGIVAYSPKIPFESRFAPQETFDANRTPNMAIYLKYILLGFRIRRLLNAIKPDIVMTMTLETNGILSLISGFHPTAFWHLGCGALSILSERSLIMRILVKHMIRFADLFYTSDNSGVQRLLTLGCPKKKIRLHPWGIDLRDFPPLSPSPELRKQYDAQTGSLVLCVRTLIPEHDVMTFVHCIPLVIEKYPATRFVLVGDGIQRGLVDEAIKSLCLNGILFCVGYIPYERLPIFFASADIYVDPVNFPLPQGRTWWNHTTRCSAAGLGYTVSLFAAMRYGCVPVLSDRPGLSDIISPPYLKYLWQPGNHEDLAEKIVALISSPEDAAEFRGLCHRIAVDPKYDWLKNCENTESEYMEIISHYRDGTE